MGNLSSQPAAAPPPLEIAEEQLIVDEQLAASSDPQFPSHGANKRQRTDSPGSDSQSFATAHQSLSQLSIQDGQRKQNEEEKSLRVIASNSDILSYSANKLALSEQAKQWSDLYTGTNLQPTLLIIDLEDDNREMIFLHSFANDGATLCVRGDNGLGKIAGFIAEDDGDALMDVASYHCQASDELPSEVKEMMSQLEAVDTLIEVGPVANHSLGFKRVNGELHFTHVRDPQADVRVPSITRYDSSTNAWGTAEDVNDQGSMVLSDGSYITLHGCGSGDATYCIYAFIPGDEAYGESPPGHDGLCALNRTESIVNQEGLGGTAGTPRLASLSSNWQAVRQKLQSGGSVPSHFPEVLLSTPSVSSLTPNSLTQFSQTGNSLSLSSSMSGLNQEDYSTLHSNKAKVDKVAELRNNYEKKIAQYESRIKELEQSLYDVAKAMDNADEKAKILGTERSEDYQSAKTKEASKAYGDSLDELTEARSKADDASVAYQESVNEVRVASQAINDARLGAPTTDLDVNTGYGTTMLLTITQQMERLKNKMKNQNNINLQYDLGCVPVTIARFKNGISLYVGCIHTRSPNTLETVQTSLGKPKKKTRIYLPASSVKSARAIILDAANQVRKENKTSSREQHVEKLRLQLLLPEFQQQLVDAGLEKLPTDEISVLGNQILASQVTYYNDYGNNATYCYCLCPDDACSDKFRVKFPGHHGFCGQRCCPKFHNVRAGSAGGGGLRTNLLDDPMSKQRCIPVAESGLYPGGTPCLAGRLLPLFTGGPCETSFLTSAAAFSKESKESLAAYLEQRPEARAQYNQNRSIRFREQGAEHRRQNLEGYISNGHVMLPMVTDSLLKASEDFAGKFMKKIVDSGKLVFVYVYEGTRAKDGGTWREEQLRSFFDQHCLFLRYVEGDDHGSVLRSEDVVAWESNDTKALVKVRVQKFNTRGGFESEGGENAVINLVMKRYPSYLANGKAGHSSVHVKGNSEFGMVEIDPVGLGRTGSTRLVFNGSLGGDRLYQARNHMISFDREQLFETKLLDTRAAVDALKQKKKKVGTKKAGGESSEDELDLEDGSLDDESDNEAKRCVFDDTAKFVASWDKRAHGGVYKLSKQKDDVGNDRCNVVDVSDGKTRTILKNAVNELLGHEAMARLKSGNEVFALDEELNTFYAARVKFLLDGSPYVVPIGDEDGEAREVSRVFIITKD